MISYLFACLVCTSDVAQSKVRLTGLSRQSPYAIRRKSVQGGDLLSLVILTDSGIKTVVSFNNVESDYVLDDFIIDTELYVFVGVCQVDESYQIHCVQKDDSKLLESKSTSDLRFTEAPAVLGNTLVGLGKSSRASTVISLVVLSGGQVVIQPRPVGLNTVKNFGPHAVSYVFSSGQTVAHTTPQFSKGHWKLMDEKLSKSS